MPSWTEFRLAIQGALRLGRFNSDFPRFFDLSPSGALRSFWLAVPFYPYYLLQIWPSAGEPAIPDMTRYVATMSIGYLYLWLVPPCVLSWVAPLIGRRAEMPGCIAIYNWMNLLTSALTLPLLVLSYAEVPVEALQLPRNVILLVLLAWETFLLMRTLRLLLWQAGLAALADYFIIQRIMLPLFYMAATGT
jgi:hypothetical protein